jgi:ParB family transcriptional regulator, chromosome partitioning protein
MSRVTMLHISALHPHPANIRQDLGDVTELAASIRAQGILQNLTVVPHPTRSGHYLVTDGNRRLKAARQARQELIPCVIRRDELSPSDVTAIMVVTGFHQKRLTPIEKAEALGKLAKTHNQAQIAFMTGLAPSTISRYLQLLELDETTRHRIQMGRVTVGDALAAVKRTRKHARPRGTQVGRPPVVEPRHFTRGHPLADRARAVCDHSQRYKLGGVACGQCWENVIRADSRPPEPARHDAPMAVATS